MSDLTLILIVLAIALAVLGAIRFDLFGLILQEFRRPPLDARPPETVQRVHASLKEGRGGDQHAADKPAIHRSGKRH
ncbi:hypothetical protein DBR47_10150 [Paucibacter sp. KBW04]|uniref:hypothetical protein n=1 Tax=Paucibacter sp. KBW04 TaxID=2153361 RepID=UPI000F582E25|nr:hypothetical protein [Paucibacter sp. KBW04]RQO59739.1 hypothetical protein DBR47_10150 [Paucibacter sp. KBW04]